MLLQLHGMKCPLKILRFIWFFSFSKRHIIEVEQLNARVVEAETKLRTEITRIKKKYQTTITELEMTIDVANKNNISLQQQCKKQAMQLNVSRVDF